MGDLLIKIAIIGAMTYGFIFILGLFLQVIFVGIGLLLNFVEKIRGGK